MLLLLQLLVTLLFSMATSLHQAWFPTCPHQGQPGDSCTSKVEACFMHTMCKPGKRLCKVVDESALCPKATSLHQTWHPACPHQGHTGDSCPSQVEACVMHTLCESGKRRYKVVDESALCPKATSLHQTWHPASPHQGHTGDSKSSLAEACYMCLWLVLVLVHNGPLVSRRSDAPWRLYSSCSQAMHCHLDLHTC